MDIDPLGNLALIPDSSEYNNVTFLGQSIIGQSVAGQSMLGDTFLARTIVAEKYKGTTGIVRFDDNLTVTGRLVANSVFLDTGIPLLSGVGGDATVTTLTSDGTIRSLAQKNYIRFHWDTLASLQADAPAASSHGMVAHVHETGKMYYAHSNEWVPLAGMSDTGTFRDGGSLNANVMTANAVAIAHSLTANTIQSNTLSIANSLVLGPNADFLRSDTRFYVSTRGSDLNNGTSPDRPFKTIKKAAQMATLHTIFVESGVYVEDNPITLQAGTAIIGDNLRRAIIEPVHPRYDMFHVNNGVYAAGLRITKLQRPAFGVSFPRAIAESTMEVVTGETTARVRRIDLHYSPEGYTAPPPVVVDPPESGTGVQATAVANVIGGRIVSISVVEKGSGYLPSERPHVSIPPPEDRKAYVVASPYIQNCSSITGPFDTEGVLIDVTVPLPYDLDNIRGSGRKVDTTGAGGGLLVDGLLTKAASPLRSMVCDAYTQVNQGGPGFLAINLGYTQLVSCFSTFCSYGVKAAWGGSINLSNSVSDFGDLALVSVGQWTIPYTQGTVTQTYSSVVSSFNITDGGSGYTAQEPPLVQLTGGNSTARVEAVVERTVIANVRVADASGSGGSGYTAAATITLSPAPTGTDAATAIVKPVIQNGVVVGVDIAESGKGYATNVTATIDDVVGGGSGAQLVVRVGRVSKIIVLNGGTNYTTAPSVSIGLPIDSDARFQAKAEALLSGNGKLILNNFSIVNSLIRRPDVGSVARINGRWYTVSNVAKESAAVATVFVISLYPGVPAVSAGDVIDFHTVSSISTGNHVCEYVGSGCTYNSLPEYGGIPSQGAQITQKAPGRVYYATTDSTGDMNFGPYFKIEQSTGTVSLNTDQFNLSGLNAIGPFKRNGVAVGEVLREVSKDGELSSEDRDTTVPTQSAVIKYMSLRSLPLGGNKDEVLIKTSDQPGVFEWGNVVGNAIALYSLNASNIALGVLRTEHLPSDIVVSGSVTASVYKGSGAQLLDLSASNVSSGILSTERLPSDIIVAGVVSAAEFDGSAARLRFMDAANVTSGILSTERLPSDIIVTGVVTAATLVGNTDASTISSGTLNTLRLPHDVTLSGTLTASTLVGNLAMTNVTNLETTLNALDSRITAGVAAQYKAGAGSVSLPSFTFSSDVSTGMWLSASNTLALSANGVQTVSVISEKVGVGSVGTSLPGYELHVFGNIYATQDIVAFSDQSVKHKLEVIGGAMDKVRKLTGYTYERSDLPGSRRHAGLIAQDCVGVLDEIVYENQDGTLALAYQNMAALFVEALKELGDTVDRLSSVL